MFSRYDIPEITSAEKMQNRKHQQISRERAAGKKNPALRQQSRIGSCWRQGTPPCWPRRREEGVGRVCWSHWKGDRRKTPRTPAAHLPPPRIVYSYVWLWRPPCKSCWFHKNTPGPPPQRRNPANSAARRLGSLLEGEAWIEHVAPAIQHKHYSTIINL